MTSTEETSRVQALAAQIAEEFRTWTGAGSGCKNGARVRIQQQFRRESGSFVMALARELSGVHGCHWFSWCLARYHLPVFHSLNDAQVEALGQGLDAKEAVDSYARILAGPAWVQGLVSEDLIHRWARAEDRWLRRAALVSTVAFNTKGDSGRGDAPHTLAVCRLLVGDHDEMVSKALSWALRALAAYDPQAVRAFVAEYEGQLAPQVRREVATELGAGPKKRKRRSDGGSS